ncbi:MAG TPA: hypothetical protein VGU25_11865 [Acidobacteriaceae bacterium]|nr:hypothetical protein [Acidobacteriaceae bacterium]
MSLRLHSSSGQLQRKAEAVPRVASLVLKSVVAALVLSGTIVAAAQDIHIGATYVCNGERMFVENCNIRDTSDTSKCMVGHPDTVLPNGLMKYTYETRGDLKKLLPTCKQPSAQQLAAAKAFQDKQQAAYNANVAKSEQQMAAIQQQQARQDAAITGGPPPPSSDPETRAMNRCITSGRLPASCTGNALLGHFTSMIGQVTSGLLGGDDEVAKAGPDSGAEMDGVFVGAGNWRVDFVTDGVLVNCAYLAPDGHHYKINFRDGNALIVLDTTPKPLVLTLHRDNTLTAPGPVTIDGVVPSGTGGGGSTPGHTESHTTTTTQRIDGSQVGAYSGDTLSYAGNGQYDATHTTTTNTYVAGTSQPTYTTFSPRRVTCPALNLSTKGATVGIETMQTNLLKTMFGGDKGPPTPPGIRMHGIYAANTGFSVQFFPESAVLGCGPDAARAYPYSVTAEGSNAVININAPDHPLKLVLKPDGSLDAGSTEAYQVHGRFVAGQNDNGDFTFGPMERSCNLAVMTPSKTIPTGGGSAASMVRTAAADPATMSTPKNVPGNATLSIVSGFPAQAGAPNPLASHPYTLLRDSIPTLVAKAGVAIPAGSSAYKVFGVACGTRSPDCQKIIDAIKASAASSVRADANGGGTFPAVPPGTYYLMISARYNNQALMWDHPVQLKAGANSMTLSPQNASPMQ